MPSKGRLCLRNHEVGENTKRVANQVHMNGSPSSGIREMKSVSSLLVKVYMCVCYNICLCAHLWVCDLSSEN
jgi:hypothetical protein